MDPQLRLELDGRRRPVQLSGPPGLGVVPKQRSPAVRIDVHAAGEIAADPVEEPLSVAFPPELPSALGTPGYLSMTAEN